MLIASPVREDRGIFFLGIGAMAARAALTREIEVRILYLRLLYVITGYFIFF